MLSTLFSQKLPLEEKEEILEQKYQFETSVKLEWELFVNPHENEKRKVFMQIAAELEEPVEAILYPLKTKSPVPLFYLIFGGSPP